MAHSFGDESRDSRLAIASGDPIPPGSQPGSIADGLAAGLSAFPDGRFVFIEAGGSTHEVTYADVFLRARRVLRSLRNRGVRPGDKLVLQFHAAADFVPALWAGLLAGAVPLPLARSDASRRGAARSRALDAHLSRVLGDPLVIGDRDSALPLAALEAEEPDGDFHRGAPGDPRILVLTSGTTATPNLVVLSERALIGRWWAAAPARGRNAAYLSWSPFDHVMGLGLFGLNLPTKVHLAPAAFVQSPSRWLDAIEKHRVTHATMTNFGMGQVTQAVAAGVASGRTWDLSSVVRIGVGAEAISADVCRRFIAALRPFGLRADAIILGYGLSECGPVVGGTDHFDPDRTESEGPFPVLDKPTGGHAVRIVDDNGRLMPERTIGAIEVKGTTMALGYHGDEIATRALFTADGWLRTGDLGHLSGGRLTVTGRAKEIVVIHARKYACAEIEGIASAIDGIRAAYAVSCRSHDGARSQYALFVVMEGSPNSQLGALLRQVRARLATHFGMAPVHLLPIDADRIPRTANGKVQRLDLAAQLEAGAFGEVIEAVRPLLETPGSPLASDTERQIAAIWSDILGADHYGRDDDFYERGGDSLSAEGLLVALEKAFGRSFPTDVLSERTTIRRLAALAEGRQDDDGLAAPSSPQHDDERPVSHRIKRNAEGLHLALRIARTWSASLHDRLVATERLVAYGMAEEANVALRDVAALVASLGRPRPPVLSQLAEANAHLWRAGIPGMWRQLGELGQRLLSSEEESVLWKAPASNRLLVVFCSMYGDFWVSGPVLHCMLRETGSSILYLKDPSERGLLGGLRSFSGTFDGLLDGIERSAASAGARDIRIMGFSSGGYAGLLAAIRLKAAAFLGFSIRTDMVPSVPPDAAVERYYAGVPDALRTDLLPLIRDADAPRRGVLYYGANSDSDAVQAERLAAFSNFVVKRLANSGHNSVLPLIASGEFERAVRRLLR